MTAVPGETPRSPLTMVGPVLVTVEPPRTPKLSAVPNVGADLSHSIPYQRNEKRSYDQRNRRIPELVQRLRAGPYPERPSDCKASPTVYVVSLFAAISIHFGISLNSGFDDFETHKVE